MPLPLDTIRERVDAGLLHAKIKQAQLARDLGVASQAIAAIKSGETLRGRLVEAVSKAIGCTPDWLIERRGAAPLWARESTEPRPPVIEGRNYFEVPMLGLAAAANGHSAEGSQVEPDPPARIDKRWQAIKISGESGMPLVWPGQTVFVDVRLPAKPDRIVVIDRLAGPILKRYVGSANGTIFLASINSGLGSLTMPESDLLRPPLVVVGVLFTDSVAK